MYIIIRKAYLIIFIYNNYFIMRLFYRFLNFIDLLIREKIIDFFIITFFSFIIFFLFFSSYLFYLPRLPRYNKVCDKAYAKAYAKTDKACDNICDKYYYYNEKRFNNINKFNIKAFFPLFLFLSFYLSRLSRYNEICDKAYIKTYVEINKICDNAYNRYYCYDKEKFNNINKPNIRDIITFFLIKILSLFISLKKKFEVI